MYIKVSLIMIMADIDLAKIHDSYACTSSMCIEITHVTSWSTSRSQLQLGY